MQLPNKLIRNRQTPTATASPPGSSSRASGWNSWFPWSDGPTGSCCRSTRVVQDGPESYVFEKNDGHFDRRAVRVEYRDQYSAVIANDGTLTPGKMVIVSGAYQVHLAMKNKAGGAPTRTRATTTNSAAQTHE